MSGNDITLLLISLIVSIIGFGIALKLTIDVLPSIIKDILRLLKWVLIKPIYFLIFGWAKFIIEKRMPNGKKRTLIEKFATRHIDKLHSFKSLWQRTERDSRSIKMDIGEKSYELEYVLEKNDSFYSANCNICDYNPLSITHCTILYSTDSKKSEGVILMSLDFSKISKLRQGLKGHNILSPNFIREYPFLSAILIGMKTKKYGPYFVLHRSEICLGLPIRNINFKRCFKRNNIDNDNIKYAFIQLEEIYPYVSEEYTKLINNIKENKKEKPIANKQRWQKEAMNIAIKVGSKVVLGLIGGLIGANIDLPDFDSPDFETPDVPDTDTPDTDCGLEIDTEDHNTNEDNIFYDNNGNLCYSSSDVPYIIDAEDEFGPASDNITFEGNKYEQQKNTLEREIRATQKDIDYYSYQIENMPDDASKNWQSSCKNKLSIAINKLNEQQNKMNKIMANLDRECKINCVRL